MQHYLVHTRGHSYAFSAGNGSEINLPPRLKQRVAEYLTKHQLLEGESVTFYRGKTGILLQRVKPDLPSPATIPGFDEEEVSTILEAAYFAFRDHYEQLAEHLDLSDEYLKPLADKFIQLRDQE